MNDPYVQLYMYACEILELLKWETAQISNCRNFILFHFIFFCFFIYFFRRFWSFYRAAERLHWSFLFLATSSTYLPTCNHIVNIITLSIKSGSSIVFTPSPSFCRAGWASDQIFKKGGLDRISVFKGGLLEKGDDSFQGGGAVFTWKIN